MRKLWPILLLGIGLFYWNKSCNHPMQEARSPGAGNRAADSVSGNAVRQWERQPNEIMEQGNAAPQPGGLSSKAMMDSARQGLQNPGNR